MDTLTTQDIVDAAISATHVDLRVASNLHRDGIWVCPDDVTLARRLSEVAQRGGAAARDDLGAR